MKRSRILSLLLALVIVFVFSGTAAFAETRATSPTLNSVPECITYVREQMKARVNSISFFYSPGNVNSELTDQIYDGLFTYNVSPVEGDYLRWNKIMVMTSYAVSDSRITFTVYYTSTADQETAVANALPGVMNSIITSGMSNYEKVRAIYKYITDNVKLDTDSHGTNDFVHMTAYGALINKKAANIGYALLLYRMCLTAGIDCRIVTGQYNGNGHVWNIVRLGNKYYNVDATFDSETITLTDANGQTRTGHPYWYLLRGSKNFGKTHTPDNEYLASGFTSAFPVSETDYFPGFFDVKVEGAAADKLIYTVFDNDIVIAKYDMPCKMGWKLNGVYQNVKIFKNDADTYYYQVPFGVSEVSLVPFGDINLDGKLSNADSTKIKYILKTEEDVSAIQAFAADINSDGKISNADATKIKSVLNETGNITW